jgi:hypothetical protein
VQQLYERALCSLCVCADVWLRYLAFFERELKQASALILATYERATRNCPWSGQLWAGHARALERFGSADANVDARLQAAVGSSALSSDEALPVFLAWIEHLCRRKTGAPNADKLREVFAAGAQYLAETPSRLRLLHVWASVEANKLRTMTECRRLYEEILRASGTQVWLLPIHIGLKLFVGV